MTYYHRLSASDAFGIQRVYTDDGLLDETMAVKGGDVVLAQRGHHPCGAPYGFDLYYLNVMAGPLRKWRFIPAPEVEWMMKLAARSSSREPERPAWNAYRTAQAESDDRRTMDLGEDFTQDFFAYEFDQTVS